MLDVVQIYILKKCLLSFVLKTALNALPEFLGEL